MLSNRQYGPMTERTPAGDVFTQVVLQILSLNGFLHRAGDELTRSVGQTGARWQVMGAIAEDAAAVAEIGRRMSLARQSVQRIADVLVDEGIAVYKVNPDHQRAKLLALTTSGRKTLHLIRMEQAVWANRVGKEIGERPLKQITALLQPLLGALEVDPICNEES
jgi:DNA-binding MarR family transcriptional regulator